MTGVAPAVIPLTLALSPLANALLVVAFLFICVMLILIVLVQRPQGGGLSGAFGAGAASGSGQTVFGARTGDALTMGTIAVFVLYLLIAVGLNYAIRPPAQVGAGQPTAEAAPEESQQRSQETPLTRPDPTFAPAGDVDSPLPNDPPLQNLGDGESGDEGASNAATDDETAAPQQ